jgi:hypothetical protein
VIPCEQSAAEEADRPSRLKAVLACSLCHNICACTACIVFMLSLGPYWIAGVFQWLGAGGCCEDHGDGDDEIAHLEKSNNNPSR